MSRLNLRSLHRWLGLVAGIQLLAWTLSGLYFTLIPIEEIRGNHLLSNTPQGVSAIGDQPVLSPSAIADRHPNIANTPFTEVRLSTVLGQPIYLIDGQRYDALTAAQLPPITEADARRIVEARTEKTIVRVELVEEVAPDAEYRSGELPAWRLTLVEENAAIYVGAQSGRIRAVRTDAWRLFDLFWALHIMDYEERDDFNHLLIQSMAVLGLITVLSGLLLFFTTIRLRRRPASQ